MTNPYILLRRSVSALFIIFFIGITAAFAQTSAFTYQGRFTDSSVQQPTNGTYTMTFRLYNALTNGNQVAGTTDVTAMVTVTNGVFTTRLDFGAQAFNTTGARFLEIQVGQVFLAPRQEITSTPFSQRALNAAAADSLSANCVGCVTNAQINSVAGTKITGSVANADALGGTAANQYVRTNDSRLTDARTPTAGSANYIQNGTTAQAGNFNVSGNGTVGGTLSSTKVSVTGGVLARGGEPGGNGSSNNGYAFTGNSGDNDSGIFSTANGRVSLYTDSVERLRVEGGTTTVTGNLTTTGTITGTLADNSVGTAQVADGSLRVSDFAITSQSLALNTFTVGAHACAAFNLNGGGAVGDLLTIYLANNTPAGFYVQPTVFTTAGTATVNICNTLNGNNTFPTQNIRLVITRP